SDVGFVMAFQGVNFVGAMFWTNMADKSGKHRMIIVAASLISSFFFIITSLPKLLGYKLDILYDKIFLCFMMCCTWFFQSALFPLVDSAMISLLSRDPAFSKDQFGYQRLWASPAHSLAAIAQGLTFLAGEKIGTFLYVGVAVAASSI